MQVRRGCERNVITYSSLISACEKAGRWQLALELFSEMHREGCKPNVVTYNSLIAACAQGEGCHAASLGPGHLLPVPGVCTDLLCALGGHQDCCAPEASGCVCCRSCVGSAHRSLDADLPSDMSCARATCSGPNREAAPPAA